MQLIESVESIEESVWGVVEDVPATIGVVDLLEREMGFGGRNDTHL